MALIAVLLTILMCQAYTGVPTAAGLPVSNSQHNESFMSLTKRLFGDQKYFDSVVAKPGNKSDPILVNVSVLIEGFSGVDQRSMNFGIFVYIKQYWKSSDYDLKQIKSKLMITPYLDRVWTPKLVFLQSLLENQIGVSSGSVRLELYPDGLFHLTERRFVKIHCHMDLRWFPFDTQSCPIALASFESEITTASLRWGSSVELHEEAHLQDFDIQILTNRTKCNTTILTHRHACLRANFQLHRKIPYYVVTLYIPMALMIFISWLSFWVDIKSPPARTSLGVVSVLSTVLYGTGISSRFPDVPYAKASDVWILIVIIHVTAAFTEYVVASHVLRTAERRKSNHLQLPYYTKRRCRSCRLQIFCSDKTFRIVYLVSFLVTSVVYALTYVDWNKH